MSETTGKIRARSVRALDLHRLVNPHLTWRTGAGASSSDTKSTASRLNVVGKRRAVALWRHVMTGHEVVKRTVVALGGVENTLRVGNAKQIALDASHVFGGLN